MLKVLVIASFTNIDIRYADCERLRQSHLYIKRNSIALDFQALYSRVPVVSRALVLCSGSRDR